MLRIEDAAVHHLNNPSLSPPEPYRMARNNVEETPSGEAKG